MTMTANQHQHLIDRLPPVRGRLTADARLKGITWFRVGGPAEVLFRPADLADLQAFLKATPADIPVTVIGVASNLLIRDGGVPGVVVRLGRGLADIEVPGNEISGDETAGNEVLAGAAALDINVAKTAAAAGLSGLEFLRGVPGTIGGAVRMNAGAYGRETRDILIEASFLDRAGDLHRLPASDLGFSYRHSGFAADWICVSARLKGAAGDPREIAARMAEIQSQRSDSQPIRSRTGGSTFKNPEGAKAWQLIDAAGCRGLRIGDAMVSEQHCNFLINRGAASARDLERLGEEVRARVKRQSGVGLEWEIKRIGDAEDDILGEASS